MEPSDTRRYRITGIDLWMAIAALVSAILLIFAATQTQAQTFTVIHDFTGGQDGSYPYTGLTIDRAGNLYGTAAFGGFQGNDCNLWGGCGVIFKLTRAGSAWVFSPLYRFKGFPSGDGSEPFGRVIFGPDGSLYGTTVYGGMATQNCGGSQVGCGTVFKLNPPATFCRSVLCSWNETQLYAFHGAPDGAAPEGEIVFDSAGGLYGATDGGGAYSPWGTLFQLTPAHGAWQETVVYNFQEHLDGGGPRGGVVLDRSGNIYGTTWIGGAGNFGTAFQLTNSGSGWALNTLYSFGTGNNAFGNYGSGIFDAAGNYYGGTVNGDPDGDAYVYELSPSSGGWNYSTLYVFPGCYGCGVAANLVMDAAGNLYGTTRGLVQTPDPYGSVFRLTLSGQGWIYTDLHDFTGGSDGEAPYSSVVLDAAGNLYGTTTQGGRYGYGVVWEITR